MVRRVLEILRYCLSRDIDPVKKAKGLQFIYALKNTGILSTKEWS